MRGVREATIVVRWRRRWEHMSEVEARRYRITAVLGKGGFGKVYRARMEGPGAFTKDVAIKLMRDRDVPELTLQRFRDEARILGLVRDRAIVNVDPPTRLAGRWAVVMEYVDGTSVQKLLGLGSLPASVVAEVVQEVARGLDKVYRIPGEGGEPLRLLHRDIKPGNIQVTQDGEVKILDFGIAKAEFEAREAHTQAYIGGTRGFIAPERLEGVEGPSGDIFSLGVTAHMMLTGERPTRREMMGLDEPNTEGAGPDRRALLLLAARMRSTDLADRPTAREVEEACASIGRRSPGPSLRRWAEITVPRAIRAANDDEMVGHVLSETIAILPTSERFDGLDMVSSGLFRRRHPSAGRGLMWLSSATVMLAGAAALLAVVVLFAAVVMSRFSAPPTGPLTATPTSGAATPAPAQAVVPVRDRVQPVAALEAPAEPTLEPTEAHPEDDPSSQGTADASDDDAQQPDDPPVVPDAAQPDPRVPVTQEPGSDEASIAEPAPPEPAGVPVAASPSPEPAVAAPVADAGIPWPVTFSSVPLGAKVVIDGSARGQTPLLQLELSAGAHELTLTNGEDTVTEAIEVGHRRPTRYVWKGQDRLEFHY